MLSSSVDMPKGIMVMNRKDLQKQLDAAPIEGKGKVSNTFLHPVVRKEKGTFVPVFYI